MKALEIISSFSSKEKKLFESVIKNSKRNTLKLFFSQLKKHKFSIQKINKSQIFEYIFKQPYTKKLDYLWRNEIRILDKQLYEFMVQKTVVQTLKQQPHTFARYLLQAFYDRKLYHLYEIEFKKTLSNFIKLAQYEEATQIIHQYINYLKNQKGITYNILFEIIEYSKQMSLLALKQYTTQLRRAELLQSFAERCIQTTQRDYSLSPLTTTADLQSKEANDNFSRFLYHQTLSFHLHGIEKVEQLQQAYQYLKQAQKETQKAPSQSLIPATIALEYFLMGQYQTAHQYYQQIISHINQIPISQSLPIIFNYFSNLVKLQRYHEAIEIFEQYESHIQDNQRVIGHFLNVKAMCHIFLNQPTKAHKTLQTPINKQTAPNYHYHRIIYIILLCIKQETEDAIRETYNLLKVLKNQNEKELSISPIVSFFLQYAKLQSSPKPQQNRLKQALISDIKQFQENAPTDLINYLPFIWLKTQLMLKN